jgi:signal transduction histidine kinase
MRIANKERLATAIVLTAVGVIALAVWSTYAKVEDARRQRRDTAEIARALTSLRLVSFEYALNRHERALAQFSAISKRLDGMFAASRFQGPEQQEILARLRSRQAKAAQIFDALAAAFPREASNRADTELSRNFETQLLSRLSILEQDNLGEVFRLADLTTEQSNAAQRRLLVVILSGLALIALIKITVSWLIRRDVLIPVARLQQAAQQVAAGNWGFEFGGGGADEIGQLTHDLGSMTRSLRDSIGQIQRSNQELAVLNHELEAFSYSVSHDLRGPLRSMDGFSLALLEDYGDRLDDEGRDFLRRIRAASQRMGHLIDDLLGLSRVTRAELRIVPVNISVIARELAGSLSQRKNGHELRWLIQENLEVRADKELMRIALQNLLDNAWKFTSKTPDAVIRIGARERDGRQVCFVADNGAGFDMAYADKLFGAFQRLHHADEFPGTGIGLAIVQRIVARHGGTIWAESKVGGGATFFFTLGESKNDERGQDNPAG